MTSLESTSPPLADQNGGPGPDEDTAYGNSDSSQLGPKGQAALHYAVDRGWYVLPIHWIEQDANGNRHCSCGQSCDKPGKHPLIKMGAQTANASNDPTQVTAWWRQWPNANVAIAAGRSGLLVVDCDNHGDDDDGEFEYVAWAAGVNHDPEATLRQRTGSGGCHYFYAKPPGARVKNGTGVLPSVDVKTDGGYVLVEPSDHIDGGAYRFTNQATPVDAPKEVLELVNDKRGRRGKSGNAKASGYRETKRSGRGPNHHERDDYFNSMAFEMRKLRLGKEAALVELRERWEKTEQPPGDEYPWENVVEKVERIWESVEPDPEDKGAVWLSRAEHRTDDGNALLFVNQHVDAVRFATDMKRWFAWNGARWVPDAETLVLEHARSTSRTLSGLASEVEGEEAQKAAFVHAFRSMAASRIKAMPDLAKSDPRIAIKAGDFDADPWLLNTPSGTVDLRTGELREHRREDLIAKLTRALYDPNADMTWWLQWLDWASAGRPDWVEHLQRAAGYALTGSTGEQLFWMLLGLGANGKSTYLSVIEMVLGDYALHAEPELLTPREGASTTGVAALQGKRFVVAVETKEGKRLDERQVKQLTGSDTITARKLYQDFIEFRPTHKIFYAMNHLPKVTDVTPAFWRRVLLVPWDSVIPKEQQRPDVAEWIVANHGPAVLRWAVEGCLKYQRDGLAVPDYVRARTQQYQAEEDILGAFISAHLVRDDDGWASTSDVWAAFQRWCEQERVRSPLGQHKLLDEVERRLGVQRGRISWEGAKVRVFQGVRLDVEGER